LTFELRRDFCTAYLTAKFYRLKFNRSEVIVRTNKQTPPKTSTALRYATPVGNNNDTIVKLHSNVNAIMENTAMRVCEKRKGHHFEHALYKQPLLFAVCRRQRIMPLTYSRVTSASNRVTKVTRCQIAFQSLLLICNCFLFLCLLLYFCLQRICVVCVLCGCLVA